MIQLVIVFFSISMTQAPPLEQKATVTMGYDRLNRLLALEKQFAATSSSSVPLAPPPLLPQQQHAPPLLQPDKYWFDWCCSGVTDGGLAVCRCFGCMGKWCIIVALVIMGLMFIALLVFGMLKFSSTGRDHAPSVVENLAGIFMGDEEYYAASQAKRMEEKGEPSVFQNPVPPRQGPPSGGNGKGTNSPKPVPSSQPQQQEPPRSRDL